MMDEKEFDKIINMFIIAKGFLGISQNKITEVSEWLDNIKIFLNEFNSYFKFENATIDDMCYIIQNHKQFILDRIVNKNVNKFE